MKKQFYKDRQKSIQQLQQQHKEKHLTEEMLNTLPMPLQKHFRRSGFVGKPVAMNADVMWKKSYIRLKPNQKWKALQTLQFNAVSPIMRTAFMKVNQMFFAGKDLYKDGQGSMVGKIFNLFSVINAKGREVSQSALITSFCEMMLLSGYAFQDYIQWEEIDESTVKGILTDHPFTVSGTFHFNAEGLFSYFETNDRFFDTGKGNFIKKGFRARVKNYRKSGIYYIPQEVAVSWCLEDGEQEYFKGVIDKINYNVRH